MASPAVADDPAGVPGVLVPAGGVSAQPLAAAGPCGPSRFEFFAVERVADV